MTTDIVIPALGESISEAVIASWLKEDGDYVERDEDLVELETDKVTMPLPSPASGKLKRSVSEGDSVEVGGVVGTIDESAEAPKGGGDSADDDGGADTEATEPKADPKRDREKTSKDRAETSADGGPQRDGERSAPEPSRRDDGGRTHEPAHAGGDVRATAIARKIAAEHQIDLSTITPTGPSRRIREQDVLAVLHSGRGSASNGQAAPQATPAAGPSRGTRRERMSPLRQRIASRLVEAQQNAAMLTTFNECDMSAVMEMRSRHKDTFLEQHAVKLGFMSFFMKAVCSALRAVPNVNASIVQGEKGPEIEHHDYCDVAVAVGTEKGLVVPVLRNAESLGFAEIESGIGELAKKAREGRLTLEDMQGGTFTISNGGVYGSLMSTPILNPPQSGILGMHNILRRPVEHPAGSGQIAVRPMMYLALSYAHRIVDGEGAVTFLRHVKECIEHPERMLLGF